jgi:hypothetical protein
MGYIDYHQALNPYPNNNNIYNKTYEEMNRIVVDSVITIIVNLLIFLQRN